jgi:hypothetical protein
MKIFLSWRAKMQKGLLLELLEYAGHYDTHTGETEYRISGILEMLKNPPWDEYHKTHNWRNHVPHCLKENWSDLSDETQIVVWAICEQEANAEEWD